MSGALSKQGVIDSAIPEMHQHQLFAGSLTLPSTSDIVRTDEGFESAGTEHDLVTRTSQAHPWNELLCQSIVGHAPPFQLEDICEWLGGNGGMKAVTNGRGNELISVYGQDEVSGTCDASKTVVSILSCVRSFTQSCS